jgi:hypothetical protein
LNYFFTEKWLCDIPTRYVLAALGFSGCVVQYTLNVCLSVAIVVMVKPVTSTQHHTIDLKIKENHTMTDLEKGTTACPIKDANGSFMDSCHNQVWIFFLFFFKRQFLSRIEGQTKD